MLTIPPASAPRLSVPNSSATGSDTVSWTSASGAGSYALQAQISGGSWTTVWSQLTYASGTVTFRVKACNSVGCLAFSAYQSIDLASGLPLDGIGHKKGRNLS